MKKTLFTKGFTMVETLVAVAILMIAIVGPLTIAQKGLTAAIYARDQVTASFLAQDAMEYIKNVRDNNLSTGNPGGWLAPFGSCNSDSNQCTVDTTKNSGVAFGSCGSSCPLYLSENGYTHDTTTTKSQFSRSFYVDQTTFVDPSNNGQEATLVVSVRWTNGTISNAVTLENEIFNVKK